MPSASARFTSTGVVEALLRLTVKTANGSAPSVTVTLFTLRLGVSLSVPPAPVPSSRIVPVPTAVAIVAFTGPLSVTVKLSLISKIESLRIATVSVWLVTPGAKLSVPLPAVKSAPLAAVPPDVA